MDSKGVKQRDYKLITLKPKQPCNTNRYMKYAPFWFQEDTNTLLVQADWQHQLKQFICPTKLKVVENIEVPHIDQTKLAVIGKLVRFITGQHRYDVVSQWFVFSFPSHHKLLSFFAPPVPTVVELTERDTHLISELSNKYLIREPLRTDVKEAEFSMVFRNAFQEEKQPKELFLKTTMKSCKNDFALRPIRNFVDAVLMLAESRDMSIDLTVAPKVVLLPWNSKINSRNEARVICVDRKTVAISPQNMMATDHVLFQESKMQHKYIITQLIEIADTVASKFYYPDLVLDVYYDEESQHWKLIEINPGGMWSSSGSASFDWKEDGLFATKKAGEEKEAMNSVIIKGFIH
jgi:hypothetical protein